MYKHILIPTDGSSLATTAVKQGLDFAKAIGAEVTALTVFEPFHMFTLETEMLTDSPANYRKQATYPISVKVSPDDHSANGATIPNTTNAKAWRSKPNQSGTA